MYAGSAQNLTSVGEIDWQQQQLIGLCLQIACVFVSILLSLCLYLCCQDKWTFLQNFDFLSFFIQTGTDDYEGIRKVTDDFQR